MTANDTVTEDTSTEPPRSFPEDVQYAGFYVRFIAMLIDSIILLLPFSIVFGILSNVIWGSPPPMPDSAQISQTQDPQVAIQVFRETLLAPEAFTRILIDNLIAFVLTCILFAVFWHFYASTPGKMVFGVKIIDAKTGQPPSRRQDLIRAFAYLVSTIPLMAGFFAIMFDKRKRGWHDQLAGTLVVYKSSLPANLANLTAHKKAAN